MDARKVNGLSVIENSILTSYGERRRFRLIIVVGGLLSLLGLLGPSGCGGRRRRPFAAHVALHVARAATSFPLARKVLRERERERLQKGACPWQHPQLYRASRQPSHCARCARCIPTAFLVTRRCMRPRPRHTISLWMRMRAKS